MAKIDYKSIPKEILEILDKCYITIKSNPIEIKTIDAIIYLFDIDHPDIQGICVKKMQPTENYSLRRKRKQLLEKEYRALKILERKGFQEGNFKVPKVIGYFPEHLSIVEERIYGKSFIELAKDSSLSEVSLLGNYVGKWLAKLHSSTQEKVSTIKIKDTPKYREFKQKVERKRYNLDNQTIKNLNNYLENIGELSVTLPICLTHGDASPIHYMLTDTGIVYGIDFNASEYDIPYVDIGTLISNSKYWFGNLDNEKGFEEFIKGFIKSYDEFCDFITDSRIVEFFVIKSEYDKYRENIDLEHIHNVVKNVL